MKIVHVLPITPGVLKESLTYYTSKDVTKYSLVTVPLRGKSVPGIVMSFEDVSDVKSRLRSSSFSLKRVERVSNKTFFLPEFMGAVLDTAEHFACNSGGVISGLVPSGILEMYIGNKNHLSQIPDCPRCRPEKEIVPENLQNIEKYAVQASDDDRFSVYRGVIREEFAKGSSVFLVAPEILSAEKIYRELGRGIEQYTFLVHGKMPQKEIFSKWKSIIGMNHPVLVVGTPLFTSIPRTDFGVFILEEESCGSYQSFSRPYFDFRYFLESYADKANARFIV
jgi:primosomal protein N'